MHSSDRIRGSLSSKLKGKKIVLAMTGSIACVECVKLARQLIRHGADVVAVMSKEATQFLSPESMKFATGNDVITELTGRAEHTGNEGDILLIAPCTANTISKIALGIADNAVTTFALAFDKKIMIAPAMHLSMYENEVIKKNMEICRERGIKFIPPKIEENKAKMADVDRIVEEVLRAFGKDKGKKVLIIGGPTYEPMDDVRVITNLSSGKMSMALAMEAYERGMEVKMWASFDVPPYISSKKFRSVDDIKKLVEMEGEKYHAVINCAAISDFVVDKKEGKMEGGKEISIDLQPAPRINPMLKKIADTVISFKLEKENVVEEGMKLMEREGVDYVVCNTIESIGGETTKIWILGKKGVIREAEGEKRKVANEILDLI